MTQQDYDIRMAALNAKMQEELQPFTNEYNRLQKTKDILKTQILKLAEEKHAVGLQMRDICDERSAIRAKYTIAKQLLYIERPERKDAGECGID